MNLVLDLLKVPKNLQFKFCEYIINYIKDKIENTFPFNRCEKMEVYINENNVIKWQNARKDFISAYNIYRLIVNNFEIRQLGKGKYDIFLNHNETIPNSYTKIYSICLLLEYGTLSVKKCGILTELMHKIADNLDSIYTKFLVETNK